MTDERTALVTGAARGIGRAIARRLASEGYSLVVVDADADGAAAVAAELDGRSASVDVTDEAAVRSLATDVSRLDLLVNNAGIYPGASIADVPLTDFRRVLDVNVLGPLLLTQAFLAHLTAVGGSVVNIASMAAGLPTPGTGAYGPSKAALVALTKLMAIELAHTGVRFNAVAPGGVVTEGTATHSADPEREARTRKLIPLGRRAQPEDIADVVPFLAGPDARYITGQVLYVEGGLMDSTIDLLRVAQSGGAN